MPDKKELYSSRIRAGRKTYFFDVMEDAETGGRYLKLSESTQSGQRFDHSRIIIDMEHADDFLEAMADAVRCLMSRMERKEPAQAISQKPTDKAYSVAEKREKHPNAYAPWTDEDDARLEQLYCEGKKNKELAALFGRDPSAIASRIKKLDLKNKYGR